MLAQSETWSEYEHHNTWKLLVRVTPNGQVSFPSDLWGGQVSDKQITKESRALDLFDNVMVDIGLDISKIVPDGMTVNMPPFLAGQEQMTAAETEGDDEYYISARSSGACYWQNSSYQS